MTTKQKLIKLKELAREAGANIYQRARLATEVLTDIDWIATEYEGDEGLAMDSLESQFFSDLRGYVSFGRLRQLYSAYPDEAKWKELRYDLAAMEELYDDDHAGQVTNIENKRTSWKAVAKELQEQNRILQSKLNQLERENSNLRLENSEIKNRLGELKRMMELEPATT